MGKKKNPQTLESAQISSLSPTGQMEPHSENLIHAMLSWGASQVALVVKNLPANAGDIRDSGSIPGSGRSLEGGRGNPLQYSCLEHGERSVQGYSPQSHKESDTTESQLSKHACTQVLLIKTEVLDQVSPWWRRVGTGAATGMNPGSATCPTLRE